MNFCPGRFALEAGPFRCDEGLLSIVGGSSVCPGQSLVLGDYLPARIGLTGVDIARVFRQVANPFPENALDRIARPGMPQASANSVKVDPFPESLGVVEDFAQQPKAPFWVLQLIDELASVALSGLRNLGIGR